ncbi:MAG: hypothetical protein ABEJ66_02420 [Candidatus Nanohaloarchaea archaeon]
MDADDLASRILDIAAEYSFVTDFSIEVHEGVVLESRLELEKGFVDIYSNSETGKTAYAWIVDGERVYGADNTGGWHIHPFGDPGRHESSDRVDLEDFFDKVSGRF